VRLAENRCNQDQVNSTEQETSLVANPHFEGVLISKVFVHDRSDTDVGVDEHGIDSDIKPNRSESDSKNICDFEASGTSVALHEIQICHRRKYTEFLGLLTTFQTITRIEGNDFIMIFSKLLKN
jgi:hypothetical protein